MIAPEGFVPFSVFFWQGVSDNLLFEAEDILKAKSKSLVFFSWERRDDLTLRWLLDYCKSEIHLFDLSSNRLVRVDAHDLFRQIFYADLSSPAFLASNVDFDFDESIRRKFNMCEPIPAAAHIEFDNLVVEYQRVDGAEQTDVEAKLLKKISEFAETSGFARVPIFVESETGRISLDLYKALSAHQEALESCSDGGGISVGSWFKVLADVEGWFLCVPERLIGDSWQKFCEECIENYRPEFGEWGQENIPPTIGRPRKQGKAAAAYKKLYPEGHSGASWPHVARAISGEIGDSISVDTIKRSLGQK